MCYALNVSTTFLNLPADLAHCLSVALAMNKKARSPFVVMVDTLCGLSMLSLAFTCRCQEHVCFHLQMSRADLLNLTCIEH